MPTIRAWYFGNLLRSERGRNAERRRKSYDQYSAKNTIRKKSVTRRRDGFPPWWISAERGRLGKGGSKGGKPRRGKQSRVPKGSGCEAHETTPPAALGGSRRRPSRCRSLRRHSARGRWRDRCWRVIASQSTGHDNAGVLAGTRPGFTIAVRPANHAAAGVIFAPRKNHDSCGTRVDTESPIGDEGKAAKKNSQKNGN